MAFFAVKRDAASGVDGLTWPTYEADLERNLTDLHERVHRGAYRALPSRRIYIPKPDGRQRPLAVAALEDKIVQRATAAVLNAIYEEDFLGFSYGFRPGRGAHDALDALMVALKSRKVNFIFDADIRSFFDTVSQEWLIRFLEHRIGDKRIIRLVQKWLKAGVLEDGVVSVSERGTGQGAVISPLLANIYLHYVLDLWAERWRRREATGDMIIVRYADDFIVGFQREADARRFWDDMRNRFEEFSLSLNPDKTRLIEFGRFAAERRAQRGLGKPETFNFLGFTFICERNSRGQFLVKRITRRDRMRATLREIKDGLRRRMHQPIPEQGAWIEQVVRGFFAYHAVPTNGAALKAFYYYVERIWLRTLRRRSQKDRFSWQRMHRLAADWIPKPRILTSVSPSHTQGGSRVRESRPHGSGRGAVSNDRPYRASCDFFSHGPMRGKPHLELPLFAEGACAWEGVGVPYGIAKRISMQSPGTCGTLRTITLWLCGSIPATVLG